MNFEEWLCKNIKLNINSMLPEYVMEELKKKYTDEAKKMKERKENNYIWELLSVHLDPISILLCGRVCWEWYRWSRANVTWLSKRNVLVKKFPEILSWIDKDTVKNNHNTRMINVEILDVPKFGIRGCETFKSPYGIWRLYTKHLLPMICEFSQEIIIRKVKSSHTLPLLLMIYRFEFRESGKLDYTYKDNLLYIRDNILTINDAETKEFVKFLLYLER